MKIAPLYHALKKEQWANTVIVHTGQHYDLNMSDVIFQDLGLPEPDIHLGIGSGTHAEQTGNVMIAYEKILLKHRPDLIIVAGDVNSTIACTLAAVKITYPPSLDTQIPKSKNQKTVFTRPLVAHLEAGLRSFDRTMPEEINRLVTDSLADILWTPSPDGDENLIGEGVPCNKIKRVGNIMIDSLEMLRSTIEKDSAYKDFGVKKGDYCLITLHRPSNVDNPEVLNSICNIFINISKKRTILFPVHPRTRKNLEKFGLLKKLEKASNIILSEPLSYIRFMNLVFNCNFVITDSGGIQEETTYLGIPCLTMRPNTERPVTVSQGTNILCSIDNIEQKANNIVSENLQKLSVPELWDGKTASRVVKLIKEIVSKYELS
jgi:UDP-N-acetylglucosamine 2-epimerase (non-hydrolysing)